MERTQLLQKKKRLSPKHVLGLVIALAVVFLLLNSVVGLAQKYLGIRNHIKDLKVEHATLEEKKANLVATNQYLATSEGMEQALREKYNVVKPGEGMIVITTPDVSSAPARRTGVSKWWDDILRGIGIRKD